ncbi:hypothetical protein GIB67_042631 [Kingdonia uniflora]|uniref:Uncharacterized protein n=1 Tax=Kingdonia uniflora TaxID=39325 RepID=A0A7J7M1F1_9MAGN|nr:hypothetical protein GIB67_042631 [Kingdonia uniflora]
MQSPHIAGKTGIYRLSHYMRSEDPETARTYYFLIGHTCSDGSFLTPYLEAIVASSHVRRHEREVGIHFVNFHWDEVVVVGRAIFPHNRTNNPNEYDILVDLVIDEDAEVSGRRGMFFRNIPVGEWFKYPSLLLKIINEDATNRSNEILYCTSEHSSKGCTSERNLQTDLKVSENGWKVNSSEFGYVFQGDCDGYDLVVADTMHKANFTSRICHSGHPNCEANRVTVVDGMYLIGVRTVRGIRDSRGEEFVVEDEAFNCTNEERE